MSNSHKNVVAADAHAPAAHKATHEDGGADEINVTGLTGVPTRASLGLDTTDSPQLAGINIGHASDTTLARVSAGNLAVEGNALYRAGGTDVAVADGGTGASTAAAAFNALSPMTTQDDLIIGGASGAGTRLGKGSDGQVLTVDPSTHHLVWATPSAGSGDVATDTIWDAAGDLAVGSGANTAGRLAKGNAGAVLAMFNGAVAWNAGTSFPASPATNDRYLRTDLGLEFYYDGTRWLSMQLFLFQATGENISASAATRHPIKGDVYVVEITSTTYVSGTNNGSNYWTIYAQKSTYANSDTAIGNNSTSGDAGSVFVVHTAAIGAVVDLATYYGVIVSAIKNNAPGNLYYGATVSYRRIAT